MSLETGVITHYFNLIEKCYSVHECRSSVIVSLSLQHIYGSLILKLSPCPDKKTKTKKEGIDNYQVVTELDLCSHVIG